MENEGKSKSRGLMIVIALLIIIILGLVGYICCDKGVILSTNETKDVENKNTTIAKNDKGEELSINSSLVKTLYNKVENLNSFCGGLYYSKDNMTYDDMDKDIKGKIVGMNLAMSRRNIINCQEKGSLIPDSKEQLFSICSLNKRDNSYDTQYIYSKDYVETIYKELFGTDKTLDTSMVIVPPNVGNKFGQEFYYYVDSVDGFVLYNYGDGFGGSSCTINTSIELERAIRKNDEIILTERVKSNDAYENKETDDKFIYTFKKDTDDAYVFVSRKKTA